MPDQDQVFPVAEEWKGKAWIDAEGYQRAYERSLRDPEGFWAEQAARLDWIKRPSRIREVSFGPKDVHIRWFADGALNAAVNCRRGHSAPRSSGKAMILPRAAPSPTPSCTPKSASLPTALRRWACARASA
jgi:acetyl-CoA synthetase